jgi:hypothetical protein
VRIGKMLQPVDKIKTTKLANIITPDNDSLIEGGITLVINPGAPYDKIADFKRALSKDPNINIISSGGNAGKGNWVKLDFIEPVPLFQVLYHLKDVLVVARKGSDIHITLFNTNV